MHSVCIDVGSAPRAYQVEIAAGAAARLGELLHAHGLAPHRIVVSSPAVWEAAADRFGAFAEAPILVPDGEGSKQLETVSRLYDELIRAGADRHSTVVAIGGGVIGDVAGFAAATFLRGLPIVHVPTTLLAQVDSAIGGKVGVNHRLGKNLIGAFHPPRLVVVDPTLLDTLPQRQLQAGLYEVVKYGVIADAALFRTLEWQMPALLARQQDALTSIIAWCCRIKAQVVTADERERGERRILNFGHTAGHALEAVSGYARFLHGEAVAHGMLIAAQVAVARSACDIGTCARLAALVRGIGPLPAVHDLSARACVEAMRRDKKVIDGRLHFVLPRDIGRVEITTDVQERELDEALVSYGLSL